MAVTYSSYLKLDELLELQRPLSAGPEHDELLFIVIHQVYELWFKEILHELDHLHDLLGGRDLTRALHTLKRVLTVLKVIVGQVDVLETMTPLEFLSFRSRLESGSGFQSYQFRELEFALGHKVPSAIDRLPERSPERRALERRLRAPTLWDAVLHYLHDAGYPIPERHLARDVREPVVPDGEVQGILADIYRERSRTSELCERLVDLDEGVQEWRYRHLKMVERTIGARSGTGGSSGAAYLASTLNRPLFPDLWAIRSQL